MTVQTKSGKKESILTFKKKISRTGILFAVLGSLIFAVSEACAKYIALDIEAEVIISLRFIIHALATAPFLIKDYQQLPSVDKPSWIYLILCGICTGLTTYFANYSYHFIPLMDAFVLTNAQPIFAAIIAWLWLKEKLTLYDFCFIVLTLIGVVVACQPSFLFGSIDTIDSESRLIGSIFGILCGVFMASITCVSRKLKNTPSSLVSYMQGVGGVFLGFIGGLAMSNLYLRSSLFPIQYVALFFSGILGFLARGCFTLAVQTEGATIVSVLQTLEIPFSFLAQMIMLNTYPNSLGVIGALIVMISTFLLTTKEHVRTKAAKLGGIYRSKLKPKIKKIIPNEETKSLLTDTNISYDT